MNQIKPRENLAEAVALELASRIETGRYAPKSKLPSSEELCVEFGVSRTVIREAMASLRISGLVTTRQGLGAFVAERATRSLGLGFAQSDDIRSALNILEFRLGVETQAVALAARRRTPEALADIARAHDAMQRVDANDPEAEARADLEFHRALARATGNPHFSEFIEVLQMDLSSEILLKHMQSAADYRIYLATINEQHANIFAAIARSDPQAATAALAQHLEESLERYRAVLEGSRSGPHA
ncbi:FadR/GntR family transcriptional regulator [Devosia sp. SL43]|uniref:FadR/GntR family transcriptional regulator n=1 Tax=Devosia sp. SL43 TaxID=2806348 RepID=UPI001F2D330D|nr:FadR/GntR family transcriptional regulator [Devosia sp. SL43]UJW86548.1 FadR family transcriptional regulator [Devosia sp. SL43]